MTKLPTTPRQHTPTVDADHNPTTCFVCGMHAFGIGVNPNPKHDPHYICRRCAVGIDNYKKIDRLDDYELRALDAGVDAVGEYIAEHGVTDLAHFDELMQRMMVKAAWEGCARGLRAALSEAPF
ncbi:hypothetical protein G6L34_08670 [Agrobacterium tumefaciens]|uniref:DUF6511 domain-containing protein n=1 Tax=Agrobacterium TaxID=357 RepID=UPI001571FC81|nr:MULTISPECIES: DUF6511 domain-containing protein [Agrobacterium]MCW8279882.1 hypothetical protein [Agrobacterium sp. InxBP2]NTA48168.1 hypothetical protein [Agrobacterium tumefaciens]